MAELTFKGLRTFAAFLDAGVGRDKAAQATAAKAASIRMLAVARAMYGQDPPLATLRESTQNERMGKGYSANEPLLREGHLRDSVRAYSTPTLAVIESSGEYGRIAAYHEFGYTTRAFGNKGGQLVAVEPRPVFRYTMMAVQPFVVAMSGQIAKKTLGFE